MRRRITLLVAATTSVVLLAFLLPAATLVARVAEARAMDTAQAQVQVLIPAVALQDRAGVAQVLGGLTGGTRVGVRWPTGEWLGDPAGEDGVDPPVSADVVETSEGTLLRQPVERSDGRAMIQVLVPEELQRSGVARTWLVLAGLGGALFLLALVIADRLARSLTRPITELAGTAHTLGTGDLSARVEPDGPAEVREVGEALNRLAGRIGELLTAEREAAADLAHRLRTPLTALRLDAEALPSPDREHLLDDVDALSRGIDEVISEARRPVREGLGAACDAAAVVADRVRFWSVLAEDEQRRVDVDVASGPLPVRVPAADLAAAVDALLGNVFTHTPDGTALAVQVRPREGGGALVTVRDEGPGVSEGAVERGHSGAGSTGLGLDIARRTAEAGGGRLRFDSSPAGTAVTLELAPPR